MNEIIETCPQCGCDTLHSFEYAGHSLKCYDCYSCSFHKDEKVRHFDNQINNKPNPYISINKNGFGVVGCRVVANHTGKHIPVEIWSEIITQEELNIAHNLYQDSVHHNMTCPVEYVTPLVFTLKTVGKRNYLVITNRKVK